MRILLAVDGSASADRALDLVAALPWHDGGRVRIVSVAPSRAEILGVPWSLAGTTDAVETEEAVLRVHRDALETAERELRSVRCDLIIEPVLLSGRPASLIVDEARADAGRPGRHRSSRPRRLGVGPARLGLGGGRRPRDRVRSSWPATIGSGRSSSPTTGPLTHAPPRRS